MVFPLDVPVGATKKNPNAEYTSNNDNRRRERANSAETSLVIFRLATMHTNAANRSGKKKTDYYVLLLLPLKKISTERLSPMTF
jgi:hypothetical protein